MAMIRNKQQKFRKYGKALEVLPPGVRTPGHRINPEAIASVRPDARTGTGQSFTKINLSARPLNAPLYLSFTFFWKYCPLTILTIDLSNNLLKGSFPSDILFCSQIQSLDLSYNGLIGEIPTDGFTNLANLTFLNLSYNQFDESNILRIHYFARFNSSSFLRSGLLAKDRKLNVGSIVLLVFLLIFVFGIIGCFGWRCLLRLDLLPFFLQRKHKFTQAILKAAIDGFSEGNLVGRNKRVEIYKGILRDGSEVLIEIHRGKFSFESHRDFVEECGVLVQLDHKNVVQVLGWCDNREFRAMATRWTDGYMIVEWLSRNPQWKHMLKVLMRVVETMCYRQDQWPQVGCDIRTSSIFLSNDHEPLISRLKVQDKKKPSKNVYKFGVFLLELVSNRSPHKGFETGDTRYVKQSTAKPTPDIENDQPGVSIFSSFPVGHTSSLDSKNTDKCAQGER
ncbi:hypothetical protein MRB53_020712 [Persea americana]|uniref:Uncharacterized protein n=1 Tax=Persea americana TaxID=3435 RepID=A0ACC2L1W2_PERAE|nr:hypothetical protein MRB53_020712 [Persea americana]